MRLATLISEDKEILAAHTANGAWLDVKKAAQLNGVDASQLTLYTSMQSFINGGNANLTALAELLKASEAARFEDALISAEHARLAAPIPRPLKNVFCVGRNYAEHIAEGERAQNKKIGVTDNPVYFTKPPTAVVGHNEPVLMFKNLSEAVDYEVELAVIIGKPGRNISMQDAFKHVYGYSILNDITARDVQRRHGGQYFKGKALDGSCPMGPVIVTADEIADPHKLKIQLSVNNEMRQDGITSDMIFDIPTLIASLSEGLTLEPGDIIATGTPSGVGYAMEPPQFLKHGDVVTCNIEQIGTLTNQVCAV